MKQIFAHLVENFFVQRLISLLIFLFVECYLNYDNFNLCNFTVGYKSKTPPIRYVVVAPIDQKAVDDIIGPRALMFKENEKGLKFRHEVMKNFV